MRPFKAIRDQLYVDSLKAVAAEPYLKDCADQIFIPYLTGHEINKSLVLSLSTALDQLLTDQASMKLHTFGMSVRALNMASATVPAALRLPEHNFTYAQCVDFLHQLDWTQPWGKSILILHMMMLQLQRSGFDREAWFLQLERYQADDGTWGQADFHARMAGAFHFIPLYRLCDRVMPKLDLLCQEIINREPQGVGFGPMDALYALNYGVDMGAIEQSRINFDPYLALLEKPVAGDRHEYVAVAQTCALLEHLLSGKVDGGALRDAWAPQLWSC